MLPSAAARAAAERARAADSRGERDQRSRRSEPEETRRNREVERHRIQSVGEDLGLQDLEREDHGGEHREPDVDGERLHEPPLIPL